MLRTVELAVNSDASADNLAFILMPPPSFISGYDRGLHVRASTS